MGLFDKKYCDVCGEKIGLLGNRKLEDGNLCKDCAAKLSRWFTERRQSTVAEIKEQLQLREENRQKLTGFRPTRTVGVDMKVYVDEANGRFIVTEAQDIVKANPDIIEMSQVADCTMDIRHTRTELKRTNAEGKEVSYDPPQYEYDYAFWIEITLIGHPYINSMEFRLNGRDITIRSEARRGLLGMTTDDIHPEFNVEYREYMEMATMVVALMKVGKDPQATVTPAAAPVAAPVAAPAPAANAGSGAWHCRSCGAENTGKFCQSCGSPRPAAILRCSRCGWQPRSGETAKFCPECGGPVTAE